MEDVMIVMRGREEQDRSLYQDEHQQVGRTCVDLKVYLAVSYTLLLALHNYV